MARKVGFDPGRKSPAATTAERKPPKSDHEIGRSLAKRLITLAIIEAAGVAILIRGILIDYLIPIAIGIAWMAVVSLITLRVVLKFAGLRKRAQRRATGNWKLEDDQTP